MRLGPGEAIVIERQDTVHSVNGTLHDLFQYEGQLIVYGSTRAHQVRVFRGVVPVKERAFAGVLLQSSTAEDSQLFTKHLGGARILLKAQGESIPIVNWHPVPGVLDVLPENKKEMMASCSQVIDLWKEWRILKRMPPWFTILKNKAREDAQEGMGQGLLPG